MKIMIYLILSVFTLNIYGVHSNLSSLLSQKSPKSKQVMSEMRIIISQYKVTKDPRDLELIISKLPAILKLFKSPYIIQGLYPYINNKDFSKQLLKYLKPDEVKDFNKRMKGVAEEIINGNG